MILTCPECATGYFVEDGQISGSGRTVRCAACGARWTATPERPLELVPAADDAALTQSPTDEAAAETAALTGDDLPRAFRTRAEEEKRNRQAAILGAVWAGGRDRRGGGAGCRHRVPRKRGARLGRRPLRPMPPSGWR
ncbi:MAG: MJ0042-type zinc finger domain-containing protein [Caulobacteraceae bacterium]